MAISRMGSLRSATARMITQSVWAVAGFSLPACLGLIILAPWLMPFVFGADFAPAAMPLIILCLAQLVNAFMGSAGFVRSP